MGLKRALTCFLNRSSIHCDCLQSTLDCLQSTVDSLLSLVCCWSKQSQGIICHIWIVRLLIDFDSKRWPTGQVPAQFKSTKSIRNRLPNTAQIVGDTHRSGHSRLSSAFSSFGLAKAIYWLIFGFSLFRRAKIIAITENLLTLDVCFAMRHAIWFANMPAPKCCCIKIEIDVTCIWPTMVTSLTHA